MPNDLGSVQREKLPEEKPAQTPKDVRLAPIYQSAAGVIHEPGYDGASLIDIAKAAGLTRPGSISTENWKNWCYQLILSRDKFTIWKKEKAL